MLPENLRRIEKKLAIVLRLWNKNKIKFIILIYSIFWSDGKKISEQFIKIVIILKFQNKVKKNQLF